MARIAIIHHSGIIGGAGVSLFNTIKALAGKHEITVYVSASPRDIADALYDLAETTDLKVVEYGNRIGAMTHYSGGDKVLSPRFIYRSLLIFKQWHYWNKILKETNPDIVIVNSIILSWMSLLTALKGKKSICFVRETISGNINRPINKLFRHLLNRFNQVAFLSKYDRSSWLFSETKSAVIPDCFDDTDIGTIPSRSCASEKLGLRERSFHILYVGGVSHMKGFDIAVKASLMLNEFCDAELIVAGIDFDDRRALSNGKLSAYEAELESFINIEDNSDKIHIIGRQSDMTPCYAAADVLVFPMRSPHQARPAFEAGYYGLPVVISDFPNIKENVINEFNGLVFEPNNAEHLTDCLKRLAEDPDYRRQMGSENKKMSQANHSMKAICSAICNLIN